MYFLKIKSQDLCGVKGKLTNSGKGLSTFVYFNNDFYCYAVKNALTLKNILLDV